MRVALCLSGQLRCFKRCYPPLKQLIIDPLKADVFISTWNYQLKDDRNHEDGLVGEFIDLLNPVRAEADTFGDAQDAQFKSSPWRLHAFESVHVDRMLAMWDRIERCFRLAGGSYDLYIRCRSDLSFMTALSMSEIERVLATGEIGIPLSRDYETVRNDQFAFGGLDAMSNYVRAPDSIPQLVQQGLRLHPERMLFGHLKLIGLDTHPSGVQYRVLRKDCEENPCV